MGVVKKLVVVVEVVGVDVFIDDCEEWFGVKFKDVDFIGILLWIIIGGKGFKEGIVELKWCMQKEVVKFLFVDVEEKIVVVVCEVVVKS